MQFIQSSVKVGLAFVFKLFGKGPLESQVFLTYMHLKNQSKRKMSFCWANIASVNCNLITRRYFPSHSATF